MRKFLLPLLLLVACESEDDATEVLLFVTPSTLDARAGTMVRFDIESRSLRHDIARFDIASFDAERGTRELLTVAPGTPEYATRYEYEVPQVVADSLSIRLTFRSEDEGGNVQERQLFLTARNDLRPLPEVSSITLWSPRTGRPDALSLITLQPLLTASADTTATDIYIYDAGEEGSQTLSREWRTTTGIGFTKAANFDYAAASAPSLTAVYTHSVKQHSVGDLRHDDIILVGRDGTAIGAIKIVAVFDEAGTDQDRYLVNVKKIKQTDQSPNL